MTDNFLEKTVKFKHLLSLLKSLFGKRPFKHFTGSPLQINLGDVVLVDDTSSEFDFGSISFYNCIKTGELTNIESGINDKLIVQWTSNVNLVDALESKITKLEQRLQHLEENGVDLSERNRLKEELAQDEVILQQIREFLAMQHVPSSNVDDMELSALKAEKDSNKQILSNITTELAKITTNKTDSGYHNRDAWLAEKANLLEKQREYIARQKQVDAEITKKSPAVVNAENYPTETITVTTSENVRNVAAEGENKEKITVDSDGSVRFTGGAPSWENGSQDRTMIRFGDDVKSIEFVTKRTAPWIILTNYTDSRSIRGTGSLPTTNNAFDAVQLSGNGIHSTFHRQSTTGNWSFTGGGTKILNNINANSFLNKWLRLDISDNNTYKIYSRPLDESAPYTLLASLTLDELKQKATANYRNVNKKLALGIVYGISPSAEGNYPKIFEKLIINRGLDSTNNPVEVNKSSTEEETTTSNYHVLVVAGQSNAVGYDESPARAADYPINDRLWQLGTIGSDNLNIIPLTAYPQTFQNMSAYANPASDAPTGTSSYKGTKGLQYPLAKLLLNEIPKNDKILVVSVSYGGIALNNKASEPNSSLLTTNGNWGVNSAYNKALKRRLEKVFNENPGTKYLGTVWIQGEHNSNTAPETYKADFQAMFVDINNKLHELTGLSTEELNKRVFPTESCRHWRSGGYRNIYAKQKEVFPLSYVDIPLPEVPRGSTDPTSNETNGTGKTTATRAAHYGNEAYTTLVAPKIYAKYQELFPKRTV